MDSHPFHTRTKTDKQTSQRHDEIEHYEPELRGQALSR